MHACTMCLPQNYTNTFGYKIAPRFLYVFVLCFSRCSDVIFFGGGDFLFSGPVYENTFFISLQRIKSRRIVEREKVETMLRFADIP